VRDGEGGQGKRALSISSGGDSGYLSSGASSFLWLLSRGSETVCGEGMYPYSRMNSKSVVGGPSVEEWRLSVVSELLL
jgi:hypothetical protein